MAQHADPHAARDAASRILRRLRDAGHTAYFAGGCVRDELLGLHPTDYDIATAAHPGQVAALFPGTHAVGAAFGVVLVPIARSRGSGVVEVATFRTDSDYTDKRRPDRVSFADAPGDAQRRDFTINALFLDPLEQPDPLTCAVFPPAAGVRGRVIDHVAGLRDLADRVVRAVGDPDVRLAEDHLRALRAARFAARLGFTLDAPTAAAITRHARQLGGVSRERIGQEIRRMLLHPSRADAVAILTALGLDGPTLNEPALAPDEPNRPEPLCPTLAGLPPACPLATALAAWILDRHAPLSHPPSHELIAAVLQRWRGALMLSNSERDATRQVLTLLDRAGKEWPGMGTAARKRWFSDDLSDQALIILAITDKFLYRNMLADLAVLTKTKSGIRPDPLLTGDELVAAGLKPGPAFKRILERVYDAQLEERVTTQQEALELARSLCV